MIHNLVKKIALITSMQGVKTILLVNSFNADEDKTFKNFKPNNLEVVVCGYDELSGFIAVMSRIATSDEETIIVSEATPWFCPANVDYLSSYGRSCCKFREESNRLGKNSKLILIAKGNADEMLFDDLVWFDNVMHIEKTGTPDVYLFKDRKSNHYPLRNKIVGFSLENDMERMRFFKEKESPDRQETQD